ncbi:hypothetical protein EON68_00535 [archaeon]|nr:MAG: hypothetical protein EON68_00535 [archaeon]
MRVDAALVTRLARLAGLRVDPGAGAQVTARLVADLEAVTSAAAVLQRIAAENPCGVAREHSVSDDALVAAGRWRALRSDAHVAVADAEPTAACATVTSPLQNVSQLAALQRAAVPAGTAVSASSRGSAVDGLHGRTEAGKEPRSRAAHDVRTHVPTPTHLLSHARVCEGDYFSVPRTVDDVQ